MGIDAALSLSQRRTARLLRPSRQRPSASDSNFRSGKEEWPVCYVRCGSNLLRPILFFVAAKKNGPPATPSRLRCSAFDSNFRSVKEEWPACYDRRDNDLPRPILIFVVAKKNGSACYDRRDNGLPRPNLIFVAAKKNGLPLERACYCIDS